MVINIIGLCVFPDTQAALTQAKEILSTNGVQLLLSKHQDSYNNRKDPPTNQELSDVSKTY